VRLLGLLALFVGIAGTVVAVPAAFRARRPADLVWALVAPLAVVAVVFGLVSIVFPGFVDK
jgi:hypothetical protein